MTMPQGASRPAAAGRKPDPPNRLIFSGKNILATAMPDSIVFGLSEKGNVQVALTFKISPGQHAKIYSVPSGSPLKPDTVGELPADLTITYIKAITDASASYAIEALRNAGWCGNSFKALASKNFDGLGSTEVKLVVSVNEVDKDGNWRMDAKGKFSPQMNIDFVNSIAGSFAFKTEASPDSLDALDRQIASLLVFDGPRPPQAASPRPVAPPVNKVIDAALAGGGDDEEIPF